MHDAGISHYQITIDGEKKIHDKIKNLREKSSFEITLKNLSEIAKHTKCVLRFNFSAETIKTKTLCSEIAKIIPKNVRHNIECNIQPIWQTIDKHNGDINDILKIMDDFKNIGIKPSLKPFGLCYVDFKYYDCIYPSGELGKCENGIKMNHGKLLPNGDVDYSNADTLHYKSIFEEKQHECHKCKFLPLCWGPCSQKRYIMLNKIKKISCIWPKREVISQIDNKIINLFLTNKYGKNTFAFS